MFNYIKHCSEILDLEQWKSISVLVSGLRLRFTGSLRAVNASLQHNISYRDVSKAFLELNLILVAYTFPTDILNFFQLDNQVDDSRYINTVI